MSNEAYNEAIRQRIATLRDRLNNQVWHDGNPMTVKQDMIVRAELRMYGLEVPPRLREGNLTDQQPNTAKLGDGRVGR
jgi:hypothetical protein